jgi:hypothetical protein
VIPPVDGWRCVEIGEATLLVPPEGPRGAVRYLERNVPVAGLDKLVADVVAADAGFRDGSVRECERFFTVEGELAAHVVVAGAGGAELHLGFVILDDFYALTSAVAPTPADGERYRRLIRQLAFADTHHLGARPRRVLHDGLAGWTPLERGLRVDWLAPEFPAEPTAITMYPAAPRAAHDARPAAQLLRAHGVTARGRRVATDNGLRGARWRMSVPTRSGGELVRVVAIAAAGDYVYAVRADGADDDHVDAFLESIIPFPSASRRRETAMFEHWTL